MTTRAKPPQEITTTVVRSLAPVDLGEWLDRYARAIVEAQAEHPARRPASLKLVP